MCRYPVNETTRLVGVHVAAAILAAILVAVGAGSVLLWLQFDSAAIWSSGQVWRLLNAATPGRWTRSQHCRIAARAKQTRLRPLPGSQRESLPPRVLRRASWFH